MTRLVPATYSDSVAAIEFAKKAGVRDLPGDENFILLVLSYTKSQPLILKLSSKWKQLAAAATPLAVPRQFERRRGTVFPHITCAERYNTRF